MSYISKVRKKILMIFLLTHLSCFASLTLQSAFLSGPQDNQPHHDSSVVQTPALLCLYLCCPWTVWNTEARDMSDFNCPAISRQTVAFSHWTLTLDVPAALWKPSLLKWPRETIIYEWNRKQNMQQYCSSKHLVRSCWISWKGWVICFKTVP